MPVDGNNASCRCATPKAELSVPPRGQPLAIPVQPAFRLLTLESSKGEAVFE